MKYMDSRQIVWCSAFGAAMIHLIGNGVHPLWHPSDGTPEPDLDTWRRQEACRVANKALKEYESATPEEFMMGK